MKTISYTEKINLKFMLTTITLRDTQMLRGTVITLENRTHNYLIKWYGYEIEDGYITVFNVPVSEIESVIRIVNGYNEI